MARMLGRVAPSWCPVCKCTPNRYSDCPDVAKSKRQVRARERSQFRRMVLEETG